ncbi:hypothetical protein DF186_14170, partial [Enterococcus hirae]
MDDVLILRYLDLMIRNSVKMVYMGVVLYRIIQNFFFNVIKEFMEEVKQEFDRMKGLKEEFEVKVVKLKKDLEYEKSSFFALAVSVRLVKDTVLRYKDSYVIFYREVIRL